MSEGSEEDAGALAARLLSRLGHVPRLTGTSLAVAGAEPVAFEPTTAPQDWADSGAMALTGSAETPVRGVAGRPATLAKAAGLAFAALTGAVVDGPALLGERAALMSLRPGGRVSAGGGTRLLRCADGWWALNLARDADLVPALTHDLGSARHGPGDEWDAVGRWARSRSGTEISARTRLLGMAAGILGETAAESSLWRTRSGPADVSARSRPLAVNFGALWAAPLTGNLLSLAGFEVVDVESHTRPDPTRADAPAFYELLHAGSTLHIMDFTDRQALRDLVAGADVVIEASRPRAFMALGIDPERVLGDGRARTWIRITGHPDATRVGFGDDAAVAGGLVAWDDEGPVFCGDAIADPLTGLLAALVVAGVHSPARTSVVDIAMATVCATSGRAHTYREGTGHPAREPRVASRRPAGRPATEPG